MEFTSLSSGFEIYILFLESELILVSNTIILLMYILFYIFKKFNNIA